MAIIAKQHKKFYSRPYQQRVGLVPTRIAMVLVCGLVVIGFSIAVTVAQYSVGIAALLLLIVFCTAAYMAMLCYRSIEDSHKRFELTMDGDQIFLSTYDKRENTRVNQQISLSDVPSAEYYEPRDAATIILHGSTSSLEIPLWSFGPEAEQEIVQYVRLGGVKVTGIPSDVLIG